MSKEVLTFGNIEIEKNKFYCHKTPAHLRGVNIEKLLVSSKISFGEKNNSLNNVLMNTSVGCFLNWLLFKLPAF